MPKRTFLAFIAAAVVLVACNSGLDPNALYGTATPSPSPTPSVTPNVAVTAAPVLVTYQGSPLPNQPVSLYTSSQANQVKQTFLTTQDTNSAGSTTFSNLTGGGWYCFDTVYTPPTPGSLQEEKDACTNLWFEGITLAF